jgi:hypothetical protein
MPTLNQAQIAQVARTAGLPGDPDVWAAVAMAESSGRTDVINSIGCVGLWQINQPVHVKRHPQWTVAWLQNPVNNAKAAKEIYRSQGWNAWEAYTGPDGRGSDGPWRQYYRKGSGGATQVFDWKDPFGIWPEEMDPHLKGPLDEWFGDEPTDEFGNPLDSTGIGDVAKGLGTIAEAVQKSAVWLGNAQNWVRIGYVAGGALLVVMGLSIVAKPVLAATPAGKVAKAAGGAAKRTASAVKTKRRGGGGGE